jgi:putative glycosyltransferase (TIGR04372 family)
MIGSNFNGFSRVWRFLKRIYRDRYAIAILPYHIILAIGLRLFTNYKHFHIGQANRIGYYSYYLDIYLTRLSNNENFSRKQIFTLSAPIANEFALTKFTNQAWILRHSSVSYRFISKIMKPYRSLEVIDVEGIIPRTTPQFLFSDQEAKEGLRRAQAIGIPIGDKPIVLIFNRDSGYLPTVYSADLNFDYHNFRDFSINSMFEAASALNELGYHVVRMGRHFREMTEWHLEAYTDYTMTEPDDLLELFLFSKCEFTVGACSGLTALALLFRKPQVQVNVVPLVNQIYVKSTKHDLILPKSHIWKKSDSLVKASEIVKHGMERFGLSSQYDELGVRLLDNSEDDIRDAALEMHERLTKDYLPSPETISKQQQYFSLIAPDLHQIYSDANRKKIPDDHWSWNVLRENASYERAFPNISEKYIKRNSWMYT